MRIDHKQLDVALWDVAREISTVTHQPAVRYDGVAVDKADDQVETLFARVRQESGQLDILVNDIWGGDDLTEWGKPFWALDPVKGFAILESAIRTHILTSRYGAPLMLERQRGLAGCSQARPSFRGGRRAASGTPSAPRPAEGEASKAPGQGPGSRHGPEGCPQAASRDREGAGGQPKGTAQ